MYNSNAEIHGCNHKKQNLHFTPKIIGKYRCIGSLKKAGHKMYIHVMSDKKNLTFNYQRNVPPAKS